MAFEVRLPKLSDAMSEASISRWLKSVGESVDKGEPIVEVETEKVIVEVEAPRAGVIVEIVAPEQSVVAVDALLCRIGSAGEKPSKPVAVVPADTADTADTGGGAAPDIDSGNTADRSTAGGSSNVVTMPSRTAPVAAPPAAQPAAQPTPGRRTRDAAVAVSATPLARRVAEELGIDLTTVAGSGIGGKIVMADLQPYLNPTEQAAGAVAPSAGAQAGTAGQVTLPDSPHEDVPHSGLRRTIARRMTESKQGIPHFYMTTEADVTELLALRGRLNSTLEDDPSGTRITVNDLLLKTVALALGRVPALNATYDDQAVRRYDSVNLGFAAAIDAGLVTPVIRDCGRKTVGQIARESQGLIERARSRQLAAEELQGATFTVSNLGMYEIIEFAAIINPPQVGILAVGRPVEVPVLRDGALVTRRHLRATLSADHRAVDGATGAAFLTALKAILEHPERLML